MSKLRLVESGRSDSRVDRASRGDRRAMHELLTELAPKVHRWLFRLLGPRPDLEDQTQLALTEIARAMPGFEGRSRVSTFAYRITVRVGYRAMRHRSDVSLELVPPPSDSVDPESHAMSREALRRLHRVLDRLPKKRRVVFAMCAIEGLKPAEAGQALGLSSDIVRSRLKEARREVARRLEHDPYFRAIRGRDV